MFYKKKKNDRKKIEVFWSGYGGGEARAISYFRTGRQVGGGSCFIIADPVITHQ